jgi:hypothetical protein
MPIQTQCKYVNIVIDSVREYWNIMLISDKKFNQLKIPLRFFHTSDDVKQVMLYLTPAKLFYDSSDI